MVFLAVIVVGKWLTQHCFQARVEYPMDELIE